MSNTEIWDKHGQLVPLDSVKYDGDNSKDVAVCIVNRDRADITDTLIENIKKNQGNLSIDIYVIEMGSTEPSKHADLNYDDPDFRGKAYGHNVSVRYAKARGNYRYYFTVMNDVYFTTPDNALQELVTVADGNPDLGILSPTEPDSGYAGGICKPLKNSEYHCVSQCNYLALLVRADLIDSIGYLTPEFKYCWGAIHELSYKMYSAGYKVAYCDVVQMFHMGSSTYGKVKNTVSREEYLLNAKKFAARYMVEHYGKKWDKKFSNALSNDVKFNTYTKHRNSWQQSLPKHERMLYNKTVPSDSLEGKIESLHPWYYPVNIKGINITPGLGSKQSPDSLVKRTKYRHKILVSDVVERYDFKGKSLLDIASNCAYWSSKYAEHGATSLAAIEGRKDYVEQGQLYWNNNNFMNKGMYTFIHGNVMDMNYWNSIDDKTFDFSLCAGILYHIPDYNVLLEQIARVTKEVMIVDTRVGEDSIVQEPGGWHFDAISETSKKIIPKYDSMVSKINKLGFTVEKLNHPDPVPSEMVGNDNYNTDGRVCLFCRRR